MWKLIVSASAAGALTVALVTSLRDDHATRARDGHRDVDETQEPGRVETTGAAMPAPAATPSVRPATVGIPNAAASPDDTSTASIDAADAGDDADPDRRVTTAPPVTAPPATAVLTGAAPASASAAASDGSTTTDAAAPTGDQAPYARGASAPTAGDAGAAAPDPWAPPSMSAGAGPFTTQAPYWGASAFTSDPNAGAGRFTTEAPPWSASAFASDPNAGAGPFTTEWNIPAFGAWTYGVFGPVAPR